MIKSIAKISLVICIGATVAGACFHYSRKGPIDLSDHVTIRKSRVPDAPYSTNPRKLDDYTVAMNHLRNLQFYIENNQWRKTLIRNYDFEQAMQRLPQSQRDEIKNKLLDIAEPVFRTGNPQFAMTMSNNARMRPSQAKDPIALSKRMADVAEILIIRGQASNDRKNIRYFSSMMDDYLRTSESFLLEAKGNSKEKNSIAVRIKRLKEQILKLKENGSRRIYKN